MSAKVVVVDDEYDLLQSICGILEDEGYTVAAFGSSRGVLQALHEHPCDLLVLDVMLPKITGIELLQLVRKIPAFDLTPVILMSAVPLRRADAKTVRYDAFLLKPFDIEQLLSWVTRLTRPKRRASP